MSGEWDHHPPRPCLVERPHAEHPWGYADTPDPDPQTPTGYYRCHGNGAQYVDPSGRLLSCIDEWPDCAEGLYDPRCCRWPKSCSCDVVHPEAGPIVVVGGGEQPESGLAVALVAAESLLQRARTAMTPEPGDAAEDVLARLRAILGTDDETAP